MRKESICMTVGAVMSLLIGKWSPVYMALLICQGLDLLMGLMVALAFHTSPKTTTGGAESYVMFKGLCKKFAMWAVIAGAHQLDVVLGFNYIATAMLYSFVANEVLSLVENAGLMGIVKTDVIVNAIDILKKRAEGKDGD